MSADTPLTHVETELLHTEVRRISTIERAPENDDIYPAITQDDPGILDLAQSIQKDGLLDPFLISSDGFIISGHRRYAACCLAGITEVTCRVHPINRDEDPKGFLRLLVAANSQRIKSTSTLVKESLVKIDPKAAHQQIRNERREKSERYLDNDLSTIDPANDGRRCRLSPASQPMVDAIYKVLQSHRKYWPMSVRQIHYRLLGADAPLMHASKPDSRYVNSKKCYDKLTSIASRARIEGYISWDAIEDETRTTDLHNAFWNPAQFYKQEFKNMLSGYWRNLQQSQPRHIEIVAEKLTVRSILQPVASEHTIPLTITRGMSSLPPKKAIVDRYLRGKKDGLILLVVSDLDPAGDAIAEDFLKSMRRDFGLQNVDAYKVALTIDQVEEFNLEPSMDAKDTSPTYQAFVDRYGITDAYELEAMEPRDLAQVLTNAIEEVIDIDLYNQELEAEEEDSAHIIAVRGQINEFIKTVNLDLGGRTSAR